MEFILASHPPNEVVGCDKLIRLLNPSKVFSVRSAYRRLEPITIPPEHDGWLKLWHCALFSGILHLIWLVHRRSLLTNSEHVRRCMSDEACCV